MHTLSRLVRRFAHTSVDQQARSNVEHLVEDYLTRPSQRLRLSTLVSFGQPVTEQSVLDSVNYVLSEIPRRLATRVRSMENLPFIVGMNPFMSRVLDVHASSFRRIATYPKVTTLEQNEEFTTELERLVNSHVDDIPQMAKGLQECSRYLTPEQTSQFLDGTIRNRIAVRLMAEQHIALSRALQRPDSMKDHVGVIDLKCRPMDLIRTCGSFVKELCSATMGASPEIVVDGSLDATFAYIPVHLEYIITEILKNSFRATVENHYKRNGTSTDAELPPIVMTVSPGIPRGSTNPPFLSLRIRDQGGGVSRQNMRRIFSYAFTTAEATLPDDGGADGGPYAAQYIGGSAAVGGKGGSNLFTEITQKGIQTGLGTFYGLGYGLPMSGLYARYFGGSLQFLTMDGWGSDVFLKLPSLDLASDVEL